MIDVIIGVFSWRVEGRNATTEEFWNEIVLRPLSILGIFLSIRMA